jgi:hypothetical protein
MTANAATPSPSANIPRPRRKRRVIRWVLLAILVGGVLWISISDGPVAQEVRELVGVKQDHIIVDSTFSVGAHTFRYYKFSLPEGTVNASVVGEFKSTTENSTASSEKDAGTNPAGPSSAGTNNDNSIEAYVLTEVDFAAWRTGQATSSLYDSGNVAESAVDAEIPPGAGIYYLLFSNKSAPTAPKAVHAAVVVRYKSWLPDWLRYRKSGF